MKGILLSLGIQIPTILASQIRLVPFLGDLFSITSYTQVTRPESICFRPLSRGPFSISLRDRGPWLLRGGFHPLSRGLFFNYSLPHESGERDNVFVPFLGNLFSISTSKKASIPRRISFRPLSREPFFNCSFRHRTSGLSSVFVPFLGNLFSITENHYQCGKSQEGFRPLSREPFFNVK